MTTPSKEATAPWGGDTDLRDLLMRERFGDPITLMRERVRTPAQETGYVAPAVAKRAS